MHIKNKQKELYPRGEGREALFVHVWYTQLEQKSIKKEKAQRTNKTKSSGVMTLAVIALCAVTAIAIILSRKGAENRLGPGSAEALDISGIYEIESMEGNSANTLTLDDLELMKAMDLSLTLDLSADGTGVMDFFGDRIELTYDTEAMVMHIDGQDYPFQSEGGKIITEQNGTTMTFTPISLE